MGNNDSRFTFGILDQEENRIMECLQRLHCITDTVISCLKQCSDSEKKEILFCLLLNGLENIENRTFSCATGSVLTCGQGIDGITRALRTDVSNMLAILPGASIQSQIGRTFGAALSFLPGAADRARIIIIVNPLGSGRVLYLNSVFGGSALSPGNQPLSHESAVTIQVVRDVPITGLAFAPLNYNLGFPNKSAMNAFVSTAAAGAILAGTKQIFGHFSLEFTGEIVVPPGHNIGVQIFADGLSEGSPSIVDVQLTVNWYELDASA